MADNWQKKERENKKKQLKKEKEEKKLQRKENKKDGNDLNSMMAYVDENGNLSTKPSDPSKRSRINVEDIQISTPRQDNTLQEKQVQSGVVTFFNSAKGYGFIKDSVSGENIFLHASAAPGPVFENDKVSFEIEKGHKGPVAVNVKIIGS